MDNAMVAGQGRALSRRLLVRFSAIAVGLSAVVAIVIALFQRAAEAQINIAGIICPILISLANAFGGFFGGIFSALLAFFGCVVSG